MPSQNDNKISCHPEERSELRILPIMEDNKERWSDSEQAKSSPHPAPLPRRGNRRNITSSPSGANFDGHAESQTQCPCEDRRYSVRTSKFKTEGTDVRTIVSNVCG